MFRKTFCEIDGTALEENIRKIREYYPEYKHCIAVCKGNAYGHGFAVINYLISGGATYIAVATLEEALKAREFNTDIPMLCLEPIKACDLAVAAEHNITLTVCSEQSLKDALDCGLKLKIHLKADSGMNRLGFKARDAVSNAVKLINNKDNLELEGIYTHLATSGLNDEWYDKQIARFKELTSGIELSSIPIVHIDRSLTLVHHKKCDFANGMRLGICLYGFSQSIPAPSGLAKLKRNLRLRGKSISEPIFENSLELKTAMRLYSEIIDIKTIKRGEFAGYGASFIAERDMTVATVAIGYYDGAASAFGNAYCGGKACPILGEMCMDMMLIEAPDSAKIGDTVEIFGDKLSIKTVCRSSGLSAYRLLTGISARVPRILNGKEYYL